MFQTEAELDEALSHPTDADARAMAALDGDLLILGASGKMGPSLARLARRACQTAGIRKRILAAARFSEPMTRRLLEARDIETVACDLLDRDAVAALPDARNVVYMVGHKFGTTADPSATWAINVYAAALAAERYRDSRIVAFSTGNVYPLWPVTRGGPGESDTLRPIGEYAQSALGRERMFEFFSRRCGTPVTLLRLNYAIEPRYGVLRDVADKILNREPIDLSVGYVNVIWQRDANAIALRSFAHCASPPFVLNVTGAETVSLRTLAARFGELLGVAPVTEGTESDTALLSDASRCRELFGPPTVAVDQMIAWVADWVKRGGRSLGKPTHYEARTGEF